jgi:hypothetical protein
MAVKTSLAYESVVKAMDFRMPTDAEQRQSAEFPSDIEPIWAVITESTYINEKHRNKASAMGHPYDNATEMLSSTGTVLSYFPNRFLHKFAALTKQQHIAIYGVVDALVYMINHQGVDPETVIPNIDKIIQRMHANIGKQQ